MRNSAVSELPRTAWAPAAKAAMPPATMPPRTISLRRAASCSALSGASAAPGLSSSCCLSIALSSMCFRLAAAFAA
ncbi:hypothetical protein G6F31_020963 [Rhizopus arrhizus]|nr:hypothetical protein G6F31_020963 [Rhizopus arrhizus]